MNIAVVTGATSMIGLAAVKELVKNNVKVYAVVREASPNIDRLNGIDNIEIVNCSLDSLSQLPQLIKRTDCDVFYHFAWGHTGAKRNDNLRYQTENINFTLDAVDAAYKLGCKKFIGAGSQAEYGVVNKPSISEETPVNPCTPYGVCKYAACKLALEQCKRYGIGCIWTRIFSVYGAYNKRSAMVPACIEKMLRGEDTDFTKGEQMWDYLYSKDIGRAFFLLGLYGRDNEVYNIGSGTARPLYEYIQLINKYTHNTARVNIGALPYGENAVMQLCADIAKLSKHTGFVPEYTFERGIQENIEFIKQQMGKDTNIQ